MIDRPTITQTPPWNFIGVILLSVGGRVASVSGGYRDAHADHGMTV
jgi:hypothetical protein